MSSYLVTGSSRGIGLALVAALAAKPTSHVTKVYAAARSESDGLKKLIAGSDARVVFVPLEVTSKDSIQTAATKVAELQGGNGLDVLINNAGITDPMIDSIENLEVLDDVLRVNVTGVHDVTRAFLPTLRKGVQKKIINISSGVGSIAWARLSAAFNTPAYKVSKAALNMLSVQYALALENEGFAVVAVTPGWIRTDLGSSQADLSVEEGVQALLDLVFRASPEMSGKFFNVRVPGWENAEGFSRYNGSEIPW
ncbi:short-chain dehydrogenase-like protein [Macrophomina phaseolina]|uniref:Short-chain dehydrogenase-like protein n=2 Tax=Macrophomina phaseolina TaxID=35725 RepID=A0ABQ8G469_9PEZI|nr:short-chain dehydrogenase-like protein [Macrophomina phaseolina]